MTLTYCLSGSLQSVALSPYNTLTNNSVGNLKTKRMSEFGTQRNVITAASSAFLTATTHSIYA